MPNNFEKIPQEMRGLNNWLMWRYEETNDKPTKVPYTIEGKKASVTLPTDWCSFDEAVACYAKGAYSGIGFVFADDPFCGIDLDYTDDEQIIGRQIKIHKEFDSYSEISPSGKGLHIICRGKVFSGRRRSKIEVYSSDRFFAMTGDVYNDKPIAERQELLDILWAEMGPPAVTGEGGTLAEPLADDQVIAAALDAANGEKFRYLLKGEWKGVYPSQSEADFAIMDIIAFYTQSRNQIVRIFRNSGLGQRPKAQRADYVQGMLDRVFDRHLPLIDIGGLVSPLPPSINSLAEANAVSAARSLNAPPKNPYSLPPGLLGEIASFIYASAPRQVPEIALAAAIGLMAGICGRAYNVSQTGLNQYVLLLAETGTGKEGISRGIDMLMNAFRTTIPASMNFRGPSQIASGAALIKRFKDQPCMLCLMGEFGLRMQQMNAKNASHAEKTLLACLLDVYMKSGHGMVLQPSIYSQKENNTEAVDWPALTLLGESTPSTFYDALDGSSISNGLLPRFLVIEHKGEVPYFNENAHLVKPSFSLVDGLGLLFEQSLKIMHAKSVIEVQLSPQAKEMSRAFERTATDHINKSHMDSTRQLWNRTHLKLLKLAALVAVGVNPHAPIVDEVCFLWAKGIVDADVERMLLLFASGEVSKSADENVQIDAIRSAVKEYMKGDEEITKRYGLPTDMFRDKIIPYAYLQRRLTSVGCFKGDKNGPTSAIKKTIATLCDSGVLQELAKVQVQARYKTMQRAFIVAIERWV